MPHDEHSCDENDERLRALEQLAAEKFGRDGNGGEFEAMQKTVERHDHELANIGLFQNKIRWTIALASAAAGAIVAIAIAIFDHFAR